MAKAPPAQSSSAPAPKAAAPGAGAAKSFSEMLGDASAHRFRAPGQGSALDKDVYKHLKRDFPGMPLPSGAGRLEKYLTEAEYTKLMDLISMDMEDTSEAQALFKKAKLKMGVPENTELKLLMPGRKKEIIIGGSGKSKE